MTFSFPYTDTLKILNKWGPGCHFLGTGGSEDINALEKILVEAEENPDEPRILALFCEFPSNPLLRSPDLVRIRELADKYGFFIVVDETIGNFINVEVVTFADIVVSSLTKIFSGDANVMGGRLVCVPYSLVRRSSADLSLVLSLTLMALITAPSRPLNLRYMKIIIILKMRFTWNATLVITALVSRKLTTTHTTCAISFTNGPWTMNRLLLKAKC